MSKVCYVIGEAIAITAVGAFVVGVLYGFSCDVIRWWEQAHARKVVNGWTARDWEPSSMIDHLDAEQLLALEWLQRVCDADARTRGLIDELERLFEKPCAPDPKRLA